MSKPILLLDQHFRQVEELFRPEKFNQLRQRCDVIGGVNWPMQRSEFLEHLPNASFVVAATPELNAKELASAQNLKAVIEVSGTFQVGIDYDYCFEYGIETLSCAPGFRYAVAEMTLGLMIAGARGIVEEHERFRNGSERWRFDNVGTDFSLYGQSVGFIGYGSIARECSRLLAPFNPRIKAFDPWLRASGANPENITLCELDELVTTSRCIIIAATPTDENYQLLSKSLIEKIPDGALVIVISRAHLVDFNALVEAAHRGQIRLASDVFPHEPIARRDAIRLTENVTWSPHRAAAVDGGRHPIGDMVVHDVSNIIDGVAHRRLQPATPETVRNIIRAPLVAG